MYDTFDAPRSAARAATVGTMAALVAVAAALAAPAVASAQEEAREEAPAATIDSLQSRIAELEARLDSLLTELGAEAPEAGEEVEETEDELARLRAAADRAAEEGEAGRDTTGEGGSRTRSLQALNPEISVTGDVVGTWTNPEEGGSNVSAAARSFEFSFQSALDPYTRTKVYVGRHEDLEIAGLGGHLHDEEAEGGEEGEEGHADEEHGFEIEEGYLYWVGLPGGLGARLGKFRLDFGLYNRWHSHALLDVDRPLAAKTFLGENGLAQTGGGLTLPSLTLGPSTQTASLQVTRGAGAPFEGGNELSYLGRLQSFWDVSPATYVQFGASGLYGENDDEGLVSRVLGIDASLRWRPSGGQYRDLQVKAEWFFADRDFGAGPDLTGDGGYLQANYRLDRRWVLGARADYLDGFGDEPEVVQLAPSVSWWQSEWVRLRLQYNYVHHRGEGDNHSLLFQTVWAVGPHKHETY